MTAGRSAATSLSSGQVVASSGGRPVVTVGLPVHDGERYLQEAIDAILAQRGVAFELVIGDNGSTDATAEIARRAAERDPRVRYVRSEVNRGAAWNFNRLVDEARGRYFKWQPHDDLIAPTYLQHCVAALEADPEVVVAHALTAVTDEHGEVQKVWPPMPERDSPVAARRFRAVIDRPDHCWHVVGVMRTDVLRRTARIAPYSSSDIGLLAELSLHGRFREVPEVLAYQRDHEDRSTRRHPRNRDRGGWFTPKLEGRITFPLWRLGRALVTSLLRAPQPVTVRARAAVALGPWAWRWRDRLARELAWGVREHWRRAVRGRAGRSAA